MIMLSEDHIESRRYISWIKSRQSAKKSENVTI